MNKKIRFSLLTLLVMLCGTVFATKTVYVDPVGNGTWMADNPAISLYVFGDGDGWANSETLSDGVIKFAFDDKYTKMIIVRGPQANANSFDNKWNQTANIEDIQLNKLYKANGYNGNDLAYTVVDYAEPVADTSYKIDFNTAITTSDHAFQVASNWRHIVGTYTDYWDNETYPSYSYSETAGVDGSGALSCSTNQSSNSIYDLLVTPVVKGTVTIAAKATASYYTPQLSFFKITDNGDGTFTRGDQITVDVSGINNSAYTTITIPVDEAGERIGIRSSYVWLDDFSATEATIIPEPKITIASAVPSATTGTIYWEQQANGKVLVSYTVTVTNTGDVDLTQGTEDFSVSIINRSTGEAYATVAVPQDLAKGETSAEFVVSAEVESSLWPNSYTYINMDLKENLFGSTIQRAQSHYTAYEPKFVFRAAESTSTSSITATQAWGTIIESKTENFEIANTGTAPLTIKSITLPEGFTSDNAPVAEFTLAKGETQALNITQDATATGSFSGTLTIVYLDKNAAEQTYTLAFSTTVIGANTWTADFNGSTSSGVTYPAGAIAESGISTDYQYISSGNYNIWLKGSTSSSYATSNNKFITPKLHANAGEKLTFDVKAGYSSTNDYYAKVYVSEDRVNWGDPVAYYTYTTDADKGSEGITSSWTTKSITFDEEGDYYVAFALYGTSAIDNLVGLEKVDVAHDLYIKSVSWPDASIKSGSSQSKPSVDIIPLTNEAAENYTVKYVYGDNTVNIDSKALTASASSTTSFAASFTPTVGETTTFPGTKVVFEFTDGTKFETETFDLTVTNEPIFHFQSSKYTSRWYEPTSDYTTPYNFGKTNTADSKTFWILNWGSAPLTVKSISVPEGFTASVENMNLPAFDGTQDGLETCQQSFDVTFTATEAGTYNGNMVITYVNGAGEDATFELAISGTKLDPNKWYANFDDGGWPAGSVYQSNVSSSNGGTYSAPNYYITSSSTTDNFFITPKLTAADGDKLLFDAKLYSSYWSEGAVKVYAAATRDEVLNAEEGTTRTQLFSVSGQDETDPMTVDFQTFEVPALEGDYYYGFEISNRPYVDEIYGLTPVAVAHDWAIASSNIPAEGVQNEAYTASLNLVNLGIAEEAADSYTVTAYVDNKAFATGEAIAVPMDHQLTATGTKLSVEFVYPEVGTFPIYLEVKSGDYIVKTEPVDVNFTGEVYIAEGIEVGTKKSTGRDYGFVDWYNNDGTSTSYTDILYTKAKLEAAGLKANDKIASISFKGTNSAKTFKAEVISWVGMSTGDITYGSPNKEAMSEVVVYTGSVEFPANIESVITLPEPIVWDGESDIRVYTEAVGQGTGNWMSVQYAYDENITMSYNGTTKYGPLAYFTLEAEAPTLSGSVKNSSRTGIANATITLKADNGVEYSGTTDAEGNYNFNVIQAGLDFTATVEAEGYLKKQFVYNLGGESKTLNTTLYQSYGIVGTGLEGFSWDADKVMTQSDEDPNIFTLVVPDVVVAADNTTLEYKLRADGIWKGNENDGYQLPDEGNNSKEFAADTYTLTFTANVASHELTLDVVSHAPEIAAQLALDDEAVAVGKLRKAIEDYPETISEEIRIPALRAAINRFNADNADVEKDETAKVKTDGWKKFDGNNADLAPDWAAAAVTTYDGRSTQPAEVYEGSTGGVNRTGIIIYQDITGLTNGQYKVGFYGTAYYTNGRGFDSTMEDGANDVAYVFANDEKSFITSRIGTSFSEYSLLQFDVEVTDGNIKLGLGKDKPGTNWHTMQIYQLTWFTTAKAAYASIKVDMTAEIDAANDLKAPEHRTAGLDEFNAAIAAAEDALESNMLNVTEFETELAKLKAAEAAFLKANRYIDFAAGEYYIIDAESDKKMAAGHDYGTRGIVNGMGLDLTLTPYTESHTVTVDSRVSNGGNSHFLGENLYMDSSEWGWAFESHGSGFYIVEPKDGKYISIDANDNLVLSDTPREWNIVSKDDMMAQRLATLAAATNPVDATFLLQNPNFNRNDQRVSAWVWDPKETAEENPDNWNNHNFNGGNQTNNCAESFRSKFTIMQTISGAPAGKYTLTAQGFYRNQQGENAAPQFFANGINANVPLLTGTENSMSDASASFTNGLYTIEPIEFEVAAEGDDAGKIYVGITNPNNTQWVIFDNFQLTYYGEMITISENATYTPVDKFANVTLERTFSKDKWNTFVVPFDIDNATLKEKFGDDVQVAEYSDNGENANNVTVSFNEMATPAITANVPVLLKTSVAPASVTFSGVQVKAAEAKKEGKYFDFVGSYNEQEYVTTGNYYLLANTIYKSTSDEGTFIKGTRAYLKAKEDAGEARIVNFTIGDEIVTGINVIDANNGAKENIYNLNGQKVDNVKKGLYIKNGKKVMVK